MALLRIIFDFDDAQANLAGHFSTVLYSALLAVLEPTDRWYDFRAYIIGAEIEGIIGSPSILPIGPKDGILRGPLV